jgi:hypothetical protein
LARLSERDRESFHRSAEVVSEARRRGTTIATEVDRLRGKGAQVSRQSVRRFFGHDLHRGPGGWSVPNAEDRSYHGDMVIISTEGKVERPVCGSKARRLVAEHANAVRAFLHGDSDGDELKRFAGRRVGGVELETDPDRLEQLAYTGEVEFLDLYVEVGA